MRRLRNDLPYTFRPPKLRDWLRPLGLALNRAVHLERKYRVGKIEAEGFHRVRELNEAGHALLLAPNHSDHSDPHVVMEKLNALFPFCPALEEGLLKPCWKRMGGATVAANTGRREWMAPVRRTRGDR